MSKDPKQQLLQFHSDRVQECTVRVLQSIVTDPKITPDEQLGLLTQVADIHVKMAEMIHSAVVDGCQKAISAVSEGKDPNEIIDTYPDYH
ncbi:MAG: hypothetical protein KDD70_14950 [Bdellovibrionales bacterium]|nr:hypothetical protein [Bdellovibrionales bacterium]